MNTEYAVDVVLERLRDPGGVSVTRQDVRRLVGEVDRLVQLQHEGVKGEVTFDLHPRQTIYSLGEMFGQSGVECGRVLEVRVNQERLSKTRLWDLAAARADWFREVGTPKVWSPVGRTLLVIHPAPIFPTNVVVEFVVAPRIPAADGSELQVTPNLEPQLLDLSAALGLLALRQLDDCVQMIGPWEETR